MVHPPAGGQGPGTSRPRGRLTTSPAPCPPCSPSAPATPCGASGPACPPRRPGPRRAWPRPDGRPVGASCCTGWAGAGPAWGLTCAGDVGGRRGLDTRSRRPPGARQGLRLALLDSAAAGAVIRLVDVSRMTARPPWSAMRRGRMRRGSSRAQTISANAAATAGTASTGAAASTVCRSWPTSIPPTPDLHTAPTLVGRSRHYSARRSSAPPADLGCGAPAQGRSAGVRRVSRQSGDADDQRRGRGPEVTCSGLRVAAAPGASETDQQPQRLPRGHCGQAPQPGLLVALGLGAQRVEHDDRRLHPEGGVHQGRAVRARPRAASASCSGAVAACGSSPSRTCRAMSRPSRPAMTTNCSAAPRP